jgi:hypothetical protein
MQRGKGKAVGLMAHIEELQLPEEREAREVARIRRESKHAYVSGL